MRVGDVTLRVYTPEKPSGAGLLWIHGGGLVLGAAAMDDTLCGETARELGVTIVSVDYRLAPRHPFPAAIDDAFAGWRWLQDNADVLGVDRGRIAIGGQRAGGGIAAALVQRVHDAGDRAAAQWLFCPMIDDRTAADRSLDAADHLVWSNRDDLRGLPAAWIYASDIELFFAEDRAYADRLRASGVAVEFHEVSGAPHGFEAWAPDAEPTRDLLRAARAWLGERLAEADDGGGAQSSAVSRQPGVEVRRPRRRWFFLLAPRSGVALHDSHQPGDDGDEQDDEPDPQQELRGLDENTEEDQDDGDHEQDDGE